MDLKDKSLFIQKCFINGNWLNAESEETFDVMNPSDQTKVGTMPNCSKKDAVKAINVNLKDKFITINLKDNQRLEDSVISQLINDAGYTVREITDEKK